MLVSLIAFAGGVLVLGGIVFAVVRVIGAGTNLRAYLDRNGVGTPLAAALVFVAVVGVGVTYVVGSPPSAGPYRLTYGAGALLFLSGTALAGLGIGRRREYVLVRDAESSGTDSLPNEGPVALSGPVRAADQTVTAPFSEAQCVVCDARAEKRIEGVKFDTAGWIIERRTVESEPFYLECGLNETLVDPEGAIIDLRVDEEVEDRDRTPTTAGKRRRYTERRLSPGDTSYVFGRVSRNERTDYRDATAVGGASDCLVTDTPPEVLQTELARTVKRNAPIGAGMTVTGLGIMFVAAGVI